MSAEPKSANPRRAWMDRVLHAVPSFEPVWDREEAGHAEYVSQYPDAARSAEEEVCDFLRELRRHLSSDQADGGLP